MTLDMNVLGVVAYDAPNPSDLLTPMCGRYSKGKIHVSCRLVSTMKRAVPNL